MVVRLTSSNGFVIFSMFQTYEIVQKLVFFPIDIFPTRLFPNLRFWIATVFITKSCDRKKPIKLQVGLIAGIIQFWFRFIDYFFQSFYSGDITGGRLKVDVFIFRIHTTHTYLNFQFSVIFQIEK